MTSQKRRIAVGLGLLISVGFLWFALKGTNFREIGESLARAKYWMILPLLVSYSLHYIIKAYRWTLLLMPMKQTRTFEVFPPMMIGFMGNNLLPAHLGEFVRMYLGAEQFRLKKTQVLATIVLERIFDFLSVVLFLGGVMLVGRGVPDDLIVPGYITGAIGIIFMLVSVVYITKTQFFLAFVRKCTFFLPQKIQRGILHQLEVGAIGLYALKQFRLFVIIAATSIIQWGFMGLSAYIACMAVGIDAPLSSGFVVLAATTFAVTLPAAPGFLGSIQAAFALALVPYGVSKVDAVAASAVFHVPTYLVVTILGLFLIKRQGYKLSQLQEKAEEAADEMGDDDSANHSSAPQSPPSEGPALSQRPHPT